MTLLTTVVACHIGVTQVFSTSPAIDIAHAALAGVVVALALACHPFLCLGLALLAFPGLASVRNGPT